MAGLTERRKQKSSRLSSPKEPARRSLLMREMAAHAAERFGRDAEIRSKHSLGNLAGDRRVGPQEFAIPLLDGQAQRVDDPLIFCSRVLLEPEAERRGKHGAVFHHLLVRRPIEHQKIGVPDRIDEAFARCSTREKRPVPQPPIFRRELKDDFLAVAADHVAPKQPLRDERGVPDRLAGPLQELPWPERLRDEERFEKVEFVRRKWRLAEEIGP